MKQPLRRVEGWEKNFAYLLAQSETARFKFGQFDCALFAADVVQALCGVDLAEPYRRQYRSHAGGVELLSLFTLADNFIDAVESILRDAGAVLHPSVAFARRGDIVIALSENGDHLVGAVDLSGVRIAAPDPGGLSYLPIAVGSRAWGIG